MLTSSVLLHGDCREHLKTLPSGSVNLTITSPPYNMNLRIRNGSYCSRQIVKELSTKYEGYDDNLPMDDYYDLNKDVITELLRVSDLTFYNIQILTGNKPAIFKLMGEFNDKIKEMIIWDKVNAQPAIGDGVLNSQFELLLVLSDNDALSRKFNNAKFERGTLSNVWNIKRGKKRLKGHGATFPEELVAKIIDNFSEPGQVVLDPFMGTGTVGEVCKNSNRHFIGIELLDNYYKYCKNLLED